MGPDANEPQPVTAADLAALRLRVDQLERDLADLRRGTPAPAPPPRLEAVPIAVILPQAAPTPPFANIPRPRPSLENRLGSQVFNRIGILALLIGTAWFMKLAIDNHWIGPVGRTLAGLVIGAAIVLWSERFRRQGVPAFAYSLKAVGTGVLYLSLWAAFQLYHLLPAPAALGAMILVTAWNAFMAWSQQAELLAAYALIGAFATPLLLSTGGDHEIFLFTYLLAIDLATVALIRLRAWPRLLLGTFPATVLYFIGWFTSFYAAPALGVTSLYLALFGLTFLAASLGSRKPTAAEAYLAQIFLPLANAAFLGLGLYSVLQDAGHHAALPWLMLALAAVYLGVMRLPQGRTAAAIHLALAVVFVTIAIPLKASGHWITAAWLVEGAALFWVATRLAEPEPEPEPVQLQPATVLHWLSFTAMALGFLALLAVPYWFSPSAPAAFFSNDLASALTGVAAFATIAWLALRTEKDPSPAPVFALIAINLIAVLLALREILTTRFANAPHPAFLNPDFASALLGIAILAACAFTAHRLTHTHPTNLAWPQLAAASTIAFNLVTVLAGVREIAALWSPRSQDPTDALQQALAVSAFLMLYSALLLAAGFWRRSAFIRWQGLLLLVFTIAKTFLYDMRSLSQGYRVVSFLALGVLLMAVSFAYQKDWLSLRDPSPPTDPPEHPAHP